MIYFKFKHCIEEVDYRPGTNKYKCKLYSLYPYPYESSYSISYFTYANLYPSANEITKEEFDKWHEIFLQLKEKTANLCQEVLTLNKWYEKL